MSSTDDEEGETLRPHLHARRMVRSQDHLNLAQKNRWRARKLAWVRFTSSTLSKYLQATTISLKVRTVFVVRTVLVVGTVAVDFFSLL